MAVQVQVKEKAFQHENTKKLVLDDINLTIEKGDFLTIIGSSGCGKLSLT